MARREAPEINGGSLADIAFLLLIFFLVTTTMDIDTGLTRKLPPMPDKNQPDDQKQIKERNVFIVLINRQNQLQVQGELMQVADLKEKAKEFIENPLDAENLPEKEEKDVPFFGKYMVSKGVISLQNDRGTRYGMYIKVQDALIAAYNELRDDISMRRFGKKFENLSEEEQKAVHKIYPQRISEAEPKNIGGEE